MPLPAPPCFIAGLRAYSPQVLTTPFQGGPAADTRGVALALQVQPSFRVRCRECGEYNTSSWGNKPAVLGQLSAPGNCFSAIANQLRRRALCLKCPPLAAARRKKILNRNSAAFLRPPRARPGRNWRLSLISGNRPFPTPSGAGPSRPIGS